MATDTGSAGATVARPADVGLQARDGVHRRRSGRRRAPSSVPAGCSARCTPRRPLARRRSSPGSSAASRRHPRPDSRRARRDVPGVRRHRAVPPLRVRRPRGHVLRLLLLAAGRHRRADRVLRGDATTGPTGGRPCYDHDQRANVTSRPASSPAIVLDDRVHRAELPRHQVAVARSTAAIMWWKIAIPVLTIIVLLFKFHSGNFGSSGRTTRRVHADRHQGRVRRGRRRRHRVLLPRLRAG